MVLRRKKIVVIGGGTGTFTVLSGLKQYPLDLTAIVTMADDGGSTGILREKFGVLPPGDIRRALIALSRTDNKMLSDLFSYRFREGKGLSGHSFGNLMLTALERITGSFEKAIREAGSILSVEGAVVPVTLSLSSLCAELENGTVIRGETNIDIPKHNGTLRIKKVWLEPEATLNPLARRAIKEANLIIIGPGDLYSSIMPNLLVKGMRGALRATKGEVLYLVNLMTKFGETNGFQASDFVKVIEDKLGKGVLDHVAVCGKKPSKGRLLSYARTKAFWVPVDKKNFNPKGPRLIIADLVRPRGFIRHDPDRLARLVMELV
ncbi:MAG: gluconeogenesis factor YvcK family protein [Candidatus Liptonbacteria bacterium]